jgi:transcriptional regulator with XRE-family HTH domain
MNYEIEEIIGSLKAARKAKGLSQRDLSARAGVPQSHISRIESGKVNLQLSSLIQLARLLDLEVMLVPKKAIPAVDSIVRSTASRAPGRDTASTRNKLRKAETATAELLKALPDNSELRRASNVLRELNNFQNVAFASDALENALKPFADLQRSLARVRPAEEALRRLTETPGAFEKIRTATTTLQTLRNQLIHDPHPNLAGPKAAYDLKDDDA